MMYSKGTPPVQVTVEDDFLSLGKKFNVSWPCEGSKVGFMYIMSDEAVYSAKNPYHMTAMILSESMDQVVHSLHGTKECNWCKAAKHGMVRIIMDQSNKVKYPVINSGSLYIGKTDGPGEWQEVGYASVDGFQIDHKYATGGVVSGPAASEIMKDVAEAANLASETMDKMKQQAHYMSQSVGKWENPAAAVAESAMLSLKSFELPGAGIDVKYPCADNCNLGQFYNDEGGRTLRSVIMHLNDAHKWTREAIADWLDSVDDPENGIDLAFKVPEKEES